MDKVGIFIDYGYFRDIIKYEFNNEKIKFEKIPEGLIIPAEEKLYRVYFYDCPIYQSNPATEEEKKRAQSQDKFYFYLQKINDYCLRLGKLQKLRDGTFNQKMVDVYLSVDLVVCSIKAFINKAILITGDHDYVPAVEIAKEHGIKISLYYTKKSTSCKLIQICDEKIQITQDLINKWI